MINTKIKNYLLHLLQINSRKFILNLHVILHTPISNEELIYLLQSFDTNTVNNKVAIYLMQLQLSNCLESWEEKMNRFMKILY